MLNQTKHLQISTTILLLIIGVCASILMFWVTAYAIGASPDSLVYLDTAENILSGNGVYTQGEPMTHFPPGYPLILALVGWFQYDNILQGARFLHIILFGCNVFLMGFTVQLCTNDNLMAIGITILGFLSSFIVISSHAMVWSDPPFITLLLTTFILLTWHVLNPNRTLFIGFTLITSFAIILRFIGITFVPPIVLTLLLFGSRSLHKKLKDIVIFFISAMLPLIIWFSRNMVVAQTVADRESSFQFLGFYLDYGNLFSRFYEFVLPLPMPAWFKSLQFAIVICAIILGIVVLFKKKYIQSHSQMSQVILPATYIFFFVSYVAFLIFSQLFIEVRLAWDFRILLPAFLALVFIVISLTWSLVEVTHNKMIWLGLFFIALVSISMNSIIAYPNVTNLHNNGQGFTARFWQSSETIPALVSNHTNQKIYSNGPDIIYYITNKEADMIPRDFISGTKQKNQDYEEQIQQMCRELDEGYAFLVYMNNVNRNYLPSPEIIMEICGSITSQQFEDGIIFGISE